MSDRLEEVKQLLIGRHHSIEEIAAAFSGYAATSLPQTHGYQPQGISNAVRPSDDNYVSDIDIENAITQQKVQRSLR